MPSSIDDRVRSVATIWCGQPSSLPLGDRLAQIAGQLYRYRNPPTADPSAMTKWTAFFASLPKGSVDPDEEVMAAVEHYFYARSQVANGEYSAMNMKAMVLGYQLLKKAGVDLRHNKNNPTTVPSKLQQQWALTGVAQGTSDLSSGNSDRKRKNQPPLVPPAFRVPPNFTGSLGGTRLDTIKY
ncbi:MAG: hypothetical protein ABI343_04915 [Burkholderiaceae bacterium]